MREVDEISADAGGKILYSSISNLVAAKAMKAINDKQYTQKHSQTRFVTIFNCRVEASLMNLLAKI